MQDFWQEKRVLVGICGGIAAYKTCMLISSLAQQGAEIDVVLTQSAEAFVSGLTFATLARRPAYRDQEFWQATHGRPLHIDLAERAEAILIAPLSANTLSKLALGLADNLLTNILLASTCPVLLAPAMNTEMWLQPSIQRNWQTLCTDPRYLTLSPGLGRLACDAVGPGRLADPVDLEAALLALLWSHGRQDWRGKQILISGGGTREPIDAVRFIGNAATGRMGLALATAAAYRGATVTFVHGSSSDLNIPEGITAIAVTHATEMQACLEQHFPQADYLIMAAAVGDVRIPDPSPIKLPKAQLPTHLTLERIPDIVQHLAQHRRPEQKLIGFAAQTGDPVPAAWEKLQTKGLDAIVANPIDLPDSGFASDWNQAVLLGRAGQKQVIPRCQKRILAHHILDFIHQL